jgi:hypothetical protein
MPGLLDKVCALEEAKEVFENVTDNDKVISHMANENETYIRDSKSNLYQNGTVMNHIESIPCYQEVVLLTEIHLMGDTGPLPMYLRNKIVDMVRLYIFCNEIYMFFSEG